MAYNDPRTDFRRSLDLQAAPIMRAIMQRPRVAVGSGGSGVWTPLIKQTDEVTSADIVLSADSILQFAMQPNTLYLVRACILFDTTAAGDFQWNYTGPASPTAVRVGQRWIVPGTSAYAGILVQGAYPAAQVVAGAGTTGGEVEFQGFILNGVNAGTFAFQWAQNTSDAGQTRVLAGSLLEYMVP